MLFSFRWHYSCNNLHATQLCFRRINSGVCCKPSSYSCQLRAVGLTTRGYLHLVVLLRAHCCCYELRAAGRAYSYLSRTFKNKSDTYRRNSHDAPWSLFFGHPGVEKHILKPRKSNPTRNRRRAKYATRYRRSCSAHPLTTSILGLLFHLSCVAHKTKNAVRTITSNIIETGIWS